MAKAPTNKSRMISNAGVALIAVALVIDAWGSPPLARFCPPTLVLVAIILMQIAKQTRETEGMEIPAGVIKAGSYIANIEVAISVVDGLCVMSVLLMGISGASKLYQEIATISTLILFALTFLTFRFTRTRFDALMKAAGSDVAMN